MIEIRNRDEERLLRDSLIALSRAFPPALVMRNEANASMVLFQACQRECKAILGGDAHTVAVIKKALNAALSKMSPSIKYGLGVGSADVIVCHEGRFVALEFKSVNGAQSNDQRTWEGWVRRAGGSYCVVRSVDEAIAAVRFAVSRGA